MNILFSFPSTFQVPNEAIVDETRAVGHMRCKGQPWKLDQREHQRYIVVSLFTVFLKTVFFLKKENRENTKNIIDSHLKKKKEKTENTNKKNTKLRK